MSSFFFVNETGKLNNPFIKYLESPLVYNYRKDYRSYREGYCRGAKGEVQDVYRTSDKIKQTNFNDEKFGAEEFFILSPGEVVETADATVEDVKIRFHEGSNELWESSDVRLDPRSGNTEDEETAQRQGDLSRQCFNVTTQWRLAYRRFRIGYAHGAEGDLQYLSRHFTRSHLDILPVAQLRELKLKERLQHTTRINSNLHSQQEDEQPKQLLHCHFGAGKLGLGLALPAIHASGTKYLIWQRPSPAWDLLVSACSESSPVNNSVYLDVEITNEEKIRMMVHGPNSDVEELKESIFENDEIKSHFIFVNSENSKIENFILQHSTSFSCALGPAVEEMLGPALRRLPEMPASKRPKLFACENDHAAVERLAELTRNKIDFVLCMVDRICSSRKIEKSNSMDDLFTLRVVAEPYQGEIVLLSPLNDDELMKCPFGGPRVITPQLQSQSNYFAQRKFLIVNGMHTTLAFMTLAQKYKEGIAFNPPGDFNLTSYARATDEDREMMWGWAVARCLIIIWEHDADVMKNAHGISDDSSLCEILLNYAKQTLMRFSSVDDSTKRVLGGGVDNRFASRLSNVEEFLNAHSPLSSPLCRELLRQADISVCELGFLIHQLINDAKQFTSNNKKINRRRKGLPSLISTTHSNDDLITSSGDVTTAASTTQFMSRANLQSVVEVSYGVQKNETDNKNNRHEREAGHAKQARHTFVMSQPSPLFSQISSSAVDNDLVTDPQPSGQLYRVVSGTLKGLYSMTVSSPLAHVGAEFAKWKNQDE